MIVELSEEESRNIYFLFGHGGHIENRQYLGKQAWEVRGLLVCYPVWHQVTLCKFSAST